VKKLYLLRHAKAEKNALCEDFERKITKSGKEDLEKLFLRLQNYNIKADIIFSSPAKRTAMTAQKLAKFYSFTKEKIIFKENLYEANAMDLFEFLKGLNDELNELFLVGHNPAIIELAEFLSPLYLGSFATSSMLCLEFDISTFKDLKEHSGKVVFFECVRKRKS